MRWSAERLAAALAALALLLLAGCGGDDPEPQTPAPPKGDAVTIVQGTSPTVEGLSVGLASVVDGGIANLQVAGAGVKTTVLRGRAGERLKAGGYTIEIVRVADSAEGGTATVRVTPPTSAG